MIFYTLIIFIVSLILQIVLFIFLSPLNPDQTINYPNAILFSINAGLLIASIYSLLLFFVYWLIKAYEEIIYKNFYRRAAFVGIFVGVSLFLRIIGILDWLILAGLIIIIICAEIVLSRKS